MRKTRPPGPPYEVEIASLAQDGRGVARRDGKAVFVDGALPGERVLVQPVALHRQYDEAVTEQVLAPSPDRVEPRCAHFKLCGGCSLQHLRSERQIEFKQQALLDALTHIGKIAPKTVLAPLLGPAWGYRRKARLGMRFVRKMGRIAIGFREKHSHFVTDVQACPILDAAVGDQIGALGELVGRLERPDRIPQIEITVADQGVALVIRHLQPLSAADRTQIEAFAAPRDYAVYLQAGALESTIALRAPAAGLTYTHPAYGLRLAVHPQDFMQVNAEINRTMVPLVLDLLAPGRDEAVLDLFCGLGNFTLPLATLAASVVGVEASAEMVRRARANAEANALSNATFHTADLFGEIRHEGWARARFDKILLDPPRSGAKDLTRKLGSFRARRIVYVSCHPGTLARDASELVHGQGYRLSAAGVLDMFPHTAHVESVAVFDRN
ncbi:MAG: 23S rRNA (uracil(1939)-C(5))-methyltransferase RlmD [Thiotrichales bacterium]